MGRLLGPDANSRFVYTPSAADIASAVGKQAIVYSGLTGDTLADILTYDGTTTPGAAISGSAVYVDNDSLLPKFWFPADDVDIVYIEVNNGTRFPIYADSDERIDRISGGAFAPMMSTGITSGGEINVNAANQKAIDIAPLVGYIVDVLSNPASPVTTRIETVTVTTVELDAASQTRPVTWFLMDSSGVVLQQEGRPTNEQRRTHLQLGAVIYDSLSGAIIADQTIPVLHSQAVNQLFDLMYAIGSFSISGNAVSANGANLMVNVSPGTAFVPSFNYFHGSVLTNNPHISELLGASPATLIHLTQAHTFAASLSTLDVANYDLNGVVTPVGGGSNQSTIFRVFVSPTNDAESRVHVQYGQATYGTLADAQAAIHTENFVVNTDLTGAAVLVGYIVAIRTATNLADPLQASFHVAGKFDRP